MEEVRCLFACPVPVGHRVLVRWYLRPDEGVWSDTLERVPEQPIVEDLDTGVRYAPAWMLHTGAPVVGSWMPIGFDPREDLVADRSLLGRVEACVIATVDSTGQAQTLLLVRPDPIDTPPYR